MLVTKFLSLTSTQINCSAPGSRTLDRRISITSLKWRQEKFDHCFNFGSKIINRSRMNWEKTMFSNICKSEVWSKMVSVEASYFSRHYWINFWLKSLHWFQWIFPHESDSDCPSLRFKEYFEGNFGYFWRISKVIKEPKVADMRKVYKPSVFGQSLPVMKWHSELKFRKLLIHVGLDFDPFQ